MEETGYLRVSGESSGSSATTGVPRPSENVQPPRTPSRPEAQAYGRVLGGCIFLLVRYP